MAQHDDRDQAHRVREQQKLDKLVDAQIDKGIRDALETRAGRRMLWWALGISRAIGNSPFAIDPHVTAFNCGEQNVGNQLLSRIMEVNPDGFLVMQKEQLNEYRERQARSDDTTGDFFDPDNGGAET